MTASAENALIKKITLIVCVRSKPKPHLCLLNDYISNCITSVKESGELQSCESIYLSSICQNPVLFIIRCRYKSVVGICLAVLHAKEDWTLLLNDHNQ